MCVCGVWVCVWGRGGVGGWGGGGGGGWVAKEYHVTEFKAYITYHLGYVYMWLIPAT